MGKQGIEGVLAIGGMRRWRQRSDRVKLELSHSGTRTPVAGQSE